MYCILGDCNQEICHHCFPVKNCSLQHKHCQKWGMCREIYNQNRVVVTGCAGFIGSHVCEKLLKENIEVIGIDNLDPYYDIRLKEKNISLLKQYSNFIFHQEDICTTTVITDYKPMKVIHLASMAGVRNSIQNPEKYANVNIQGFIHILEECVKSNVLNVVYASSSSVYGLNTNVPFSEEDAIEKCNSPYAASKRAMEIFAQTYSQLHGITTIGLRFFTVYGPRGRPDMAPYKFLKAIQNNEPIDKYGDGETSRDYTYIDDIVNGIIGALQNRNHRICEVYNLGNSSPVTLNQFIATCEKVTGKRAIVNQMSDQVGDVPQTYACIKKATRDLNYSPSTSLEEGLKRYFNYGICANLE